MKTKTLIDENYIILKSTPPDHLFCPYCKEKMIGILDRISINYMIYSCNRHQPLHVEYYYSHVNDEWHLTYIIISNSNSFRFVYSHKGSNNNFRLQEYEKDIPGYQVGAWYGYKSTSFPTDYILSKTAEQVLSKLEMYKVFS